MSQAYTDILQRRANAAELSGGTSTDATYSMIERVIVGRDLGGKILDYGAGVGQLTRRLRAMRRFDCVAAADIKPVPEALAGLVEWMEQDLNLSIPGHDSEFDVVVAAEVIEHLENPRFVMREVFRMLRPGGTAIFTTPNNESWRSVIALVIRGHYVLFGDSCYPAHITALLRKDLTRIFQEANFPAPRFHFSGDGGLPGKPLVSWQRISLGLLRGVRFSDNLLAVANKPAQAGASDLSPGPLTGFEPSESSVMRH
jgi:2-polyprenyl-3-methyl-5-hydroxy-6-metoxy-1,4-benzoquinol methylase